MQSSNSDLPRSVAPANEMTTMAVCSDPFHKTKCGRRAGGGRGAGDCIRGGG
jgi:hypothetical protein